MPTFYPLVSDEKKVPIAYKFAGCSLLDYVACLFAKQAANENRTKARKQAAGVTVICVSP